MLLDPFAARTVDSGPNSGHFHCFGPNLKIRSGPNLARTLQPGLPIPELFSGPDSGTFVYACFVAFQIFQKIMSTPLTQHYLLHVQKIQK